MIDRRQFLKTLAAMTSSLALPSNSHSQDNPTSDRWGDLLPLRRLGKTNEWVTMLGLGGAHMSAQFSESSSQELIELAIESGIRFFDTATLYNNGLSEKRYGKYLTPKYRDEIFLMSKSHGGQNSGTTANTARQHLEDSLRNMKTDYLDLWTMHQIMSPADVQTRINKGILDVMVEAKEQGKVRHIGFSGHRTPEAHRYLLDHTDIFETCQLPINCADPSYGSFIRNIVPTLVDRGMGIIAMKSLAAGGFFGGTQFFKPGNRPKLCPDRISVEEAIHFTLSMPVSVLVTGVDNMDQLREKVEYVHSYTGMTEQMHDQLIAKVADLTPNKGVEFYKAEQLAVDDWNLHNF